MNTFKTNAIASITTTALLLLFQISFLSAQLIPNSNFENWEIIGGIEEPSDWMTNNEPGWISITKTTGENVLENAIKIIGNASGPEGYFPGLAYVDLKFQTDLLISGIKISYKYEMIIGENIGEARLLLHPWIDGSYDYSNVKYWDDLDPAAEGNWIQESIYFPTVLNTSEYDSVRLSIYSGGIDIGYGFQGNLAFHMDSLELITEDITAISSQKIESAIVVSPNPFTNFLDIDSKNHVVQSISLYDVYGRMVLMSSQVDRLDLGFLSEGVYYLHLELEDGGTDIKLIQKI